MPRDTGFRTNSLNSYSRFNTPKSLGNLGVKSSSSLVYLVHPLNPHLQPTLHFGKGVASAIILPPYPIFFPPTHSLFKQPSLLIPTQIPQNSFPPSLLNFHSYLHYHYLHYRANNCTESYLTLSVPDLERWCHGLIYSPLFTCLLAFFFQSILLSIIPHPPLCVHLTLPDRTSPFLINH